MQMEHVADKRTIGEKYGNKSLMEKKVISNTKYSHISQVVNTGKTIKDVHFVSDQLVSKRKSECFKRVKGSTIVKLVNQNHQTESIYNMVGDIDQPKNDSTEEKSVITSITNKSNITHQTNVTAVTYATEMLGNLADIDFIILDLRETENYNEYHIREAISYPGCMISRDKFLPQMISMKNKDGKMIILYCQDERTGTPFAGLLFQKGYDNIYFLSGGIEEFSIHYPEYCDGNKVDMLIEMKKEREKQTEMEMLKKTTSMMKKTGMTHANNNNLSTKSTTVSKPQNTTTTSAMNALKKDLHKK